LSSQKWFKNGQGRIPENSLLLGGSSRWQIPDDGAEAIEFSKGQGRIECREVWAVSSQELGRYLEQECDWPGLQLCGWIRRSRRKSGQSEWHSQETTVWVSSRSPENLSSTQVLTYLRGHWTIENGVFRVRDVSYDEDRLHGRKIAPALSLFRNIAINLLRQEGYAYIPDGWRDLASKPDRGLHLLYKRLKN
jgi:hypothetical protein